MDLLVPNLGDIDEVEVIELCVSIGDTVGEHDSIIVIESDKASMEVPAGVACVVERFAVGLGDIVGEGSLIAVITETQDEPQEMQISSQISSSGRPKVEVLGPESDALAIQSATLDTPVQIQKLEILIPDLGDIDEVEVIEVGIAVGEFVAAGELLLVLESDKASMEIPAEVGGEILEVFANLGDWVNTGSVIAVIAVSEAKGSDELQQVGAILTTDSTQASKDGPMSPVSSTPTQRSVVTDESVYAGPAVRRLARELGVYLSEISGTGNRGRVTKEDVKAYVKGQIRQKNAGADLMMGNGLPELPAIDFSKFGEIEVVPLSRIQKQVAANMHRSWLNVPHVTQHGKANISALEDFRKSLKSEAAGRDVSLTTLAFVVKACCHAIEAYPKFNSSLDADGSHIILKSYVNIGIAVDTAEGLVVPVIRGANKMGIWQLSQVIGVLAEKARAKKLALDDVTGGTFTISSLGAIGGTGFTPIVNAPEVAILGVAKATVEPLWDGEAFTPELTLPLSLSYDHRAINGVDGGRFVLLLSQLLSDIRRLAL